MKEIELDFPLQIQFRDIDRSDAVESSIWTYAEKLGRVSNRIVSCHVVISAPHRRQHNGRIYHVQIRLHVPGEQIVISSEPELNGAHEDVHIAVRDAFAAAQRQLGELVRQRGQHESDVRKVGL
jgi:ribosome-associated translation inhibitor RaiA